MNASGKELAQSIVSFLSEHGQIDQLAEVIEHLQEYYDREVRKSNTAIVKIAQPWQAEEKESLKKELHGLFHKDLEMEFVVDESVVGGFSVRVGDVMIDRTLKSKLDNVKQVLLK